MPSSYTNRRDTEARFTAPSRGSSNLERGGGTDLRDLTRTYSFNSQSVLDEPPRAPSQTNVFHLRVHLMPPPPEGPQKWD